MTYRAPVKDMLFCMKELADLEAVAQPYDGQPARGRLTVGPYSVLI